MDGIPCISISANHKHGYTDRCFATCAWGVSYLILATLIACTCCMLWPIIFIIIHQWNVICAEGRTHNKYLLTESSGALTSQPYVPHASSRHFLICTHVRGTQRRMMDFWQGKIDRIQEHRRISWTHFFTIGHKSRIQCNTAFRWAHNTIYILLAYMRWSKSCTFTRPTRRRIWYISMRWLCLRFHLITSVSLSCNKFFAEFASDRMLNLFHLLLTPEVPYDGTVWQASWMIHVLGDTFDAHYHN